MDIFDHYGFQQSFTAMMFAMFHRFEQGKQADQCATYSFACLPRLNLLLVQNTMFDQEFANTNYFGQFFWHIMNSFLSNSDKPTQENQVHLINTNNFR